MSENLLDLVKTIRDRKNKDEDKSYTSSLLSGGLTKCIDKMQEEFEGGMLEIYTEGVDKAPEVVYAKPNRLIIFDAGKHIHTVTPVTSGTRKAIAINLWQSEPLSKQNGTMCVEQ